MGGQSLLFYTELTWLSPIYIEAGWSARDAGLLGAAAIGGAKPVDVPAAGGVGRDATVWLLDEAAASKL